MADIRIYTTPNCGYCVRAKSLFKRLGLPYQEIDLAADHALRERLTAEHNWRTVPMIFVGERFIGGFDDLNELHRAGQLEPLAAS